MAGQLSVSIVDYNCNRDRLKSTLEHLTAAINYVNHSFKTEIHFIDNGSVAPVTEETLQQWLPDTAEIKLTLNYHNPGFGAAHNQAIRHLDSDYHLILNPDAYVAEDFLEVAFRAFEEDEKAVLLAPKGSDLAGDPLYLAKRYPSVTVLIQRALGIAARTGSRNALYQYQDMDLEVNFPIELASGCCMLVRTPSLVRSGGFNERFFLYFEDYDLSLRLGRLGDLKYVPDLEVVHEGGNTRQKSVAHWMNFLRSAVIFFSQHGWRI